MKKIRIVAVVVTIAVIAGGSGLYLVENSDGILLKIPQGTHFQGARRLSVSVTGNAENVTLSVSGAWKADGTESFFVGPSILLDIPKQHQFSSDPANGIIDLIVYDHPSSPVGGGYVLGGNYSGYTTVVYYGNPVYFWFYTPLSWVNLTITKTLLVRETGHSVSSLSAFEASETLAIAPTRL